jgi:hypothetical protein
MMQPNLTVQMRPPCPPTVGTDDNPTLVVPGDSDAFLLHPTTAKAFESARKAVEKQPSAKFETFDDDEVMVWPLGTASASPTKYRNGKLTRVIRLSPEIEPFYQ